MLVVGFLVVGEAREDQRAREREEKRAEERFHAEWEQDEREYERQQREQEAYRRSEEFGDAQWDLHQSTNGFSCERAREASSPSLVSTCYPGPPTRVAHVIDRDTFILRNGETVRIVGIDAPETYPVAECGGQAAKRALDDWIGTDSVGGGTVALARVAVHPDRDEYGRLLRRVETVAETGRDRFIHVVDVAEWMLRRGHSRYSDYAYTYVDRYPGERDHARLELRLTMGQYDRFEQAAADANRGGWANCDW